MFTIIVCKTNEEINNEAFKIMREALRLKKPVLGLATGSSPVGLYQKMIDDFKAGNTSYENVTTFNLDEYAGLEKNHPQSYYTFMHENLFRHIDIKEENVHIPDGTGDIEKNAADYEALMQKYSVDLQVLGIGSDGHIAFNEPGTPFEALTHVTELTEETISDNARFFGGDKSKVPTRAITQGLGTIMRAKRIVLLATGKNKANAVYGMIKGSVSTDCPASILQEHGHVTVILDEAAASRVR